MLFNFPYRWVSSPTEILHWRMNIFHRRQGHMGMNYACFYTMSIHNFRSLLADDRMKMKVVESWQNLVERKLIEIYAYVIMPNHVHLLWSMLGENGKESAAGSFAKYTAHEFKKQLQAETPEELAYYATEKRDRRYQFWKRDPLAVPVDTEKIFIQKMEYIHNNPITDKWNLCRYPEDYRWSSASFYITGIDEFSILKHFRDDE
jgi:putative transposase